MLAIRNFIPSSPRLPFQALLYMPRWSVIQFPSPLFPGADKKQFYVCECQLMMEQLYDVVSAHFVYHFSARLSSASLFKSFRLHFCRKRCLNSVSIHGLMEMGHGSCLSMWFLMDHVRNRCFANWQIYCWHKEVLLMKTNIRKLHINLIAGRIV